MWRRSSLGYSKNRIIPLVYPVCFLAILLYLFSACASSRIYIINFLIQSIFPQIIKLFLSIRVEKGADPESIKNRVRSGLQLTI